MALSNLGNLITWGIGDEITGTTPSAQTTVIYQAVPQGFGLLSAWWGSRGPLAFTEYHGDRGSHGDFGAGFGADRGQSSGGR